MSQKNTSSKRPGSRTAIYAGIGAAVAAAVGTSMYLLRRSSVSGASSLDSLPANPAEDEFGNRGDENMVEPLSLREDEILMRDRMNPYNGLY